MTHVRLVACGPDLEAHCLSSLILLHEIPIELLEQLEICMQDIGLLGDEEWLSQFVGFDVDHWFWTSGRREGQCWKLVQCIGCAFDGHCELHTEHDGPCAPACGTCTAAPGRKEVT